MRRSPRAHLAFAFAACFLVPAVLGGLAGPAAAAVRYVPVVPFEDLLFANVDGVFDAARDPATGETWYATSGGLVHVNRDRTARRLLGVADGLPTPLLYSVRFDATGMLWVGSDQGLVRVDPATAKMTVWNPGNTPDATAFIVSYAHPASDGSVWIGTHQRGIGRFWPATGAWEGPWNTSALENHPVVAGEETPSGMVLAARASGFLRFVDGTFAPVEEPEQFALASANAYAWDDGVEWFGTDAGVWRYDPANATTPWKRYLGETLSDIRVTDLDLRGRDLWVSTKNGVTVLNLTTGNASYLGSNAGLPSSYVRRAAIDGDEVLFATLRGLAILNLTEKRTTNLLTGESNGPNANSLLGGTWHRGRAWFGTTDGVTGFDPVRQSWLSLGTVDGVDVKSLPVYDVVSDEDRLWLATKKYVWMYNETSRDWIYIADEKGTNVYFHLTVDGDTLWLPEYGTGLIEYNWVTNTTRRYDVTNTGLLEWEVRDAKHTASAVFIATASGLYKLDKTTRLVTTVYGTESGFPSANMERLWLDGKDLWVGFREHGLARFNTETFEVTKIYNESLGNLPGTDVRALVRDRAHAWVGLGADGLARVNLATGKVDRWTDEDGLPEAHVNGLVLRGGILYVGTHGGVARLNTETLKFLPMHVADPAAWAVANPPPVPEEEVATIDFAPRVKITFPVAGTAVTGVLTIEGDASKPGGAIDRVEVSVADGAWQTADGFGPWSFDVDTTRHPPGELLVRARAVAGNETSEEDSITVRVVAPPKEPLAIRHTPPVGAAFAGRDVRIAAEVRGDEPLRATVYYERPGDGQYRRAPLVRQGSLWVATIPAEDALEGDLKYFLEATSGLLTTTLPEDRAQPFVLALAPPPAAAVHVQGPEIVEATAGETTRFTLAITNVGRERDNYVLLATGLRSAWVTLDASTFRLEPGARIEREVAVSAPARAFADTTTLTFTVKPVGSAAEPALVEIPLAVRAAQATVDGEPADATGEATGFRALLKRLPPPGLAPALALLALLALVTRRNSR